MKISSSVLPAGSREAGFTMTEMLIVVPLVMMTIGMVLFTHLFGVKMFEITKAKLSATDDARQAFNSIIDDIRSSQDVDVGTGNGVNFTNIPPNTLQVGSAIRIFPPDTTNVWKIYYWEAATKTLTLSTNGTLAKTVLVNSITNSIIFKAEDYQGNVLSNDYNIKVIGLYLDFYQIQYPVIKIGPGEYYDRYLLRTKVTRRNTGGT